MKCIQVENNFTQNRFSVWVAPLGIIDYKNEIIIMGCQYK